MLKVLVIVGIPPHSGTPLTGQELECRVAQGLEVCFLLIVWFSWLYKSMALRLHWDDLGPAVNLWK